MKLSELVALLAQDLERNGDAQHVALGVVAKGKGGKHYRIDAVIDSAADLEVVRDVNVVGGLACLAAEHHGDSTIQC